MKTTPDSPKLLCYGRDARLLETRQQIFQYAGFATETTEEASVLKQKLKKGEIDLLILCHSLLSEDRDMARQAARNSPIPPTLLFLRTITGGGQLLEQEKAYDGCLDPAGLVGMVTELLQDWQPLAGA